MSQSTHRCKHHGGSTGRFYAPSRQPNYSPSSRVGSMRLFVRDVCRTFAFGRHIRFTQTMLEEWVAQR